MPLSSPDFLVVCQVHLTQQAAIILHKRTINTSCFTRRQTHSRTPMLSAFQLFTLHRFDFDTSTQSCHHCAGRCDRASSFCGGGDHPGVCCPAGTNGKVRHSHHGCKGLEEHPRRESRCRLSGVTQSRLQSNLAIRNDLIIGTISYPRNVSAHLQSPL